jgi:HNH endonuclease
MTAKKTITIEKLKERLEYFPDEGFFRWKTSFGSRSPIGSVAGWSDGVGYKRIEIDGFAYKVHRLAWLWMTGTWPLEVDHIDLDRSNNKWKNLREVNRQQNCFNSPARKNNRLGVKGVSFRKTGNYERYIARIMVGGKPIRLGDFSTLDQAAKAYADGAKKMHGEFARTN